MPKEKPSADCADYWPEEDSIIREFLNRNDLENMLGLVLNKVIKDCNDPQRKEAYEQMLGLYSRANSHLSYYP